MDRNRAGQLREISPREDWAILRLTRRYPFFSSMILRDNWISNRDISTRTVRNRLKTARYRAKSRIQCHRVTPAHKQHVWHDVRYAKDGILHREERFIGSVKNRFSSVHERSRVRRQPNAVYATSNIQKTTPFEDVFSMIASWIWSLGQDIRETS